MIFMMSLFSIYTGMLYNEFVSEIESGESEWVSEWMNEWMDE
jgi:hypothetical protein